MSEGKIKDVTVAAPLFEGSAATFLMAAHELKSPLALVRQLALAIETGELSAVECDRLARQIRLTSERALRLTSNITRSVREASLFDLEPLNPLNICEEVAHELSPLYRAQDKTIRVNPRHHPPLVVGNRDLMRRILLNFGDNALHYAPGNEPVEFSVAKTGEIVRVGVRDYGPAVASDLWQQLLRRLEAQAAQPISARPQSSGLGLYLSGQFAQMMDSKIGAVRHKNGATFFVDMTQSRQLSLL